MTKLNIFLVSAYLLLATRHFMSCQGLQPPLAAHNHIAFSSSSNKKSQLHCKKEQSRRDVLASSLPIPLLISSCVLSTEKSQAISSIEAETSYNKYAKSYDDLDGGTIADKLGIVEARSMLIGQARGAVLEIGAGTGLNLSQYKFATSPTSSDGVTSLTLLDISEGMLSEAKVKLEAMVMVILKALYI